MDFQGEDILDDRSLMRSPSFPPSDVENLECIAITKSIDQWGTGQPDIE